MKTKSLLWVALFASMLLSVFMTSPVGAQSTTIGVEPDSIVNPSLVPGSTFTVEIWIRDVQDLAGLEFKLGYDTTVLTATLIEYGDIFGDTYFPFIIVINDAEGYLHYGIMEAFGEPGFHGDGRAAIITFSVDSVGESVLDLYDTALAYPTPPFPIPHAALDGYFSNTQLPPPEALEELIETIETWNLPEGTENSFTSKLREAILSLNKENENGAIHKLTAFIKQVEAQRDKKLTDEQADQLIAEAQTIIDLIKE